jgi:hypothetical protein
LSSNAVAAPAGSPLAVNALMTTTYAGVPPAWIGLYGGIDMISDPYTKAPSGTLSLTALVTVDVALSRPIQTRLLTGLELA